MSLIDSKITQNEIDLNNVKSVVGSRLIGTVPQNKNVFDKLVEFLSGKHNGIVDDLVSETDGASGADQVGITPIKVGGSNKVQTAIEELKTDTAADLKVHTDKVDNPHTVTKTQVGLSNVTNESKATMFTDPTFTGTVVGVTKAMVGLSNAENTSDANKPVSSAGQTALNLKVDKVAGKALSTNDYDNTEKASVASNTSARHSHTNKSTLDTYSQTEANLSDAVTKKHTHDNKTVLDGISEVTAVLGSTTNKVPSEKAVTDAISFAGGGDMLKAVYDTASKNTDIFTYTDNEISKLATTADADYYVSTTGSDLANGSVGTPFATVQHAIDLLPKSVNHFCTINILDGAYAETDILISNFNGTGAVIIQGNITTPANVTIGNALVELNLCTIVINGITFDNALALNSLEILNCRIASLESLVFEESITGSHIYINETIAEVSNCVTSNGGVGIGADNKANVTVTGCSGADNGTGILVENGSIVTLTDTSSITGVVDDISYLTGGRLVEANGVDLKTTDLISNVPTTTVENVLNSTSTTNALSANQGYVLNNLVSTKLPKFIGTTAGTSTALTIAIEDATLTDFTNIQARLHIDIGDNATLNLNALGAKPIYNNLGLPITAGAAANSMMNLSYNANLNRWYLLDVLAETPVYESDMLQFLAMPGSSGKIRLKVEKPTDATGAMIRYKSNPWASGDTKDTGILVVDITDDTNYKGANQWYEVSGLTDGLAYYFKAFPYKNGAYNETIGVNETVCKAGGLYLEYTMDSISGTTVNDTSGNGRNGTAHANVTYSTGKVGNRSNGSSSGGNITYPSFPSGARMLTGFFTIGTITAGNATHFMYYGSNNMFGIANQQTSGTPTNFACYGAGTAGAINSPSVTNNQSMFIALGSNGTAISCRFDNGAIQTSTGSSYTSDDVKALHGASTGASDKTNGSCDQIRLWSRVLESYEINNLYNGGAGC